MFARFGLNLVLIYVQVDRQTMLCIFSPRNPARFPDPGHSGGRPTTGQVQVGFNDKAYLETSSVEKMPSLSLGPQPLSFTSQINLAGCPVHVPFSIFPAHAKP